MLEKTIYVANDGKEFYEPDLCLEYEAVQEIVDYLVNHPDELTTAQKTITTIVELILQEYTITKKPTQ